ncbi:zinc finger BED domain-containing protein 1-like [Rhizophagus irregularis DAOM 181602=DAOM 197198]|uniref:HAT C-terminal dimerisation domain-containing protein n=2 Tax=Rhizophagus irregularis TaxID=588596 RepID=A0A015K001_RHIIW|nr:hypothetical protein RirG_250290 [Rhizophagus irregularis DAOM 197198w]GBC47331.1 zinc finger BED domain-containing protein 1-like [Rhizophagus irregularis DAOM 181602=DAOM 197198]
MAALLDPRYKSLDFLDEKQRIIQKLCSEFDEVEIPASEPLNNPASYDAEPSRSHKEYRQRRQIKNKKGNKSYLSTPIVDEIPNYLTLPLALEPENPLIWWKLRLQMFPKLAKIARKYLAVPATSVSSERLFSDAGNLINTKRTNLDTNLVAKILFLKRNIKTMHVFASEWDEDETSHVEID